MARIQLKIILIVGLILASSTMGLAEETEIFSLNTPAPEVKQTGAFGIVESSYLMNATIDEIRIDDAVLMLPNGALVKGLDYKKSDGVVIGVGNGLTNVTLTSSKNLAGNGLEILAFFEKDRKGVTPQHRQLAVYDLQTFQPLEWSFKNHSRKDKALAVYLLADISSSMDSVFPTIKSAAKEFFLNMPDGVGCSLNSFNSELHRLSKQPENCNTATKRIDGMILEGGSTDIYLALQKIYEQAAHDNFTHSLVLVISDAQQVGSGTKQDALTAKKLVNGQTFVLGLGHFRKDDLVGIADVQSSVGQHVQDDITAYFKNQSLFIKGLEYIHVKR